MRRHFERHYAERIGWLRAAVLGANDGIVSTASLVIGVAAAGAAGGEILVAGVAGLVAGAMSMAAGEYVSVSSQADAERAEVEIERHELARQPEHERRELAEIYEGRGLDPPLAHAVAHQLMEHDALQAHLRDELGITDELRARPLQASLASAASFAAGGAVPVAVAATGSRGALIAGVSMAALAVLGVLAARAGGADPLRGALRVCGWGALAMAATAAVGTLVGGAL